MWYLGKVTEGRWREEFTTRMNLIDLWKRGKPNVLEYRYPSTGRTEHHHINLFGDFLPQPVSCVKINKKWTRTLFIHDGINILTSFRMLNLHEGPPTSILIDAFKIVTAGSDGKINIIDSLSCILIRIFYSRKSKNNQKNANEIHRNNVINCMEMDKYQICVSFGNNIKVWDFDTHRVKESTKKHKSSEILSLKLTKSKNNIEDYKTSYELLKKEKKQEKINSKNSKRFNGSINEVLTEEELMAYAMMLSMEQKEQVVSSTSNANDNTVDNNFELSSRPIESDQEEILKNYVNEQEKRDYLFASEIAKQDMLIGKINKNMEEEELSKSKGGKKGKNKNNKGKKKTNCIPLDEWEGNHEYYNYNNKASTISTTNTSHNKNFNNNKDLVDMDEEEYLNYVLQLSLHDK
ncbi:hypothetical protein H8356DRAFT_1268639 [Neocallimastix lanati (nom. inval.)]|uniref:WD40 repeat-like protein n=1 Tax=Neocallimastix californiae TaxID=1754190 RepID=A0A1Y2ENA5_9FUNG|nr:hypothetical protein H8356DRAFT_1268639 [Neocallimastix sp. JGI-2020a]ORY72794.1 hypothetical protein LY90DRAFT_503466 [Neocallimastix californiae]|eukprot:ORY72794.1 hypothetical protein LY90DRAFT_503466 [Neocallimastix californiae]